MPFDSVFSFTCENCNETTENSQLIRAADNCSICAECVEIGEYRRCSWSGELHREDDLTEIICSGYDLPSSVLERNGWQSYGIFELRVCRSVLREEFFECFECSRYILHDADSTWLDDDRRICQNCYEGSYFCCENCGEIFPDACYGESGCCENCTPSAKIHSYSTDPLQHLDFWGEPKDKLYYGVELETNCSNYNISRLARECLELLGDDFVILKEDGSIGTGFEIVTAPAILEIQRDRWSDFLNQAPQGLSSWQSGRCGMHVHVSRSALSELSIGKITVLINSPENQGLIRLIAGRYADRWCAIDWDKKISDVRRSAESRRQAINLCNEDTIEFRIFRGTLHKLHFLANLEFVHAVVNYCQVCSIRALHHIDFMRWVRQQPRSQYRNLIEFVSAKGF